MEGFAKEVAVDIEPWKTQGDGHFRFTATIVNLKNKPSLPEGQREWDKKEYVMRDHII